MINSRRRRRRRMMRRWRRNRRKKRMGRRRRRSSSSNTAERGRPGERKVDVGTPHTFYHALSVPQSRIVFFHPNRCERQATPSPNPPSASGNANRRTEQGRREGKKEGRKAEGRGVVIISTERSSRSLLHPRLDGCTKTGNL